MPRPLPPLNALRAFEAAARHLSFTRAADELNVTQAAVSHQVKALEARLGVKLFRRLTRSLRLTDEGQALAPDLREAFARMAEAIERMGARGTRGTLNVSTVVTFALNWLVPRLARFQAIHPEIEVRLSTSMKMIDFAREDFDLAIRFGKGNWPGLRSDKLFDDEITPLCGSQLKDRLKRPEDLRSVTLLQESPNPVDWSTWLDAAGLSGINAKKGPQFDSTRIAVEAAMEGLGVAIGPPGLFKDELARGRLYQPFKLTVKNGAAFWVVCPASAAERAKIKAFRAWILAEARAEAAPTQAAAPHSPGRSTKSRPAMRS
jgi:DNA-binding transcriptional LysR family regulator